MIILVGPHEFYCGIIVFVHGEVNRTPLIIIKRHKKILNHNLVAIVDRYHQPRPVSFNIILYIVCDSERLKNQYHLI